MIKNDLFGAFGKNQVCPLGLAWRCSKVHTPGVSHIKTQLHKSPFQPRERLFAAPLTLSARAKGCSKHVARLERCSAASESLAKCLQLPLESPGAAGTQMLNPLLQECLSLLL